MGLQSLQFLFTLSSSFNDVQKLTYTGKWALFYDWITFRPVPSRFTGNLKSDNQ